MNKVDVYTPPHTAGQLSAHVPPTITIESQDDSTKVTNDSWRGASPIINHGYLYRGKVVLLDDQKREQLQKMDPVPLGSAWTFWYDKPDKTDRRVPVAADYVEKLQRIATVNTVQDFWSVYNNIDGPERLPQRSNLCFMRQNIKPIWEDPHNERGGKYCFQIDKDYSPLAWRDLLVLLISERIEDWLGDNVCGVSVAQKLLGDKYQIWTARSHDDDRSEEIKTRLSELLNVEISQLYFKSHHSHADFDKPTENAPASTTAPTSPTPTTPEATTPSETEQKLVKMIAEINKLKSPSFNNSNNNSSHSSSK